MLSKPSPRLVEIGAAPEALPEDGKKLVVTEAADIARHVCTHRLHVPFFPYMFTTILVCGGIAALWAASLVSFPVTGCR
jgi:hypothetical protein